MMNLIFQHNSNKNIDIFHCKVQIQIYAKIQGGE